MQAPDASLGNALSVEMRGVVKRYLLFGRRRDRAMALLGRTRNVAALTVLNDINLEVEQGEAVGIVGENGSGKSTLLRIVAGISEPNEGTVRVTPPVAPILELGLGFHPDFTGLENAVLYGELLGIGEELMKERLGDVLEFAELGEFAQLPLRTYSSGMAARLAFAVATNVDPQVLVVDEALAVGDGGFQKKCIDRMVRFKEAGRTVLFCSHAMYQITSFCERAIWLHQGRIRMQGPSQDVVREYESYLMQREKRRLSGKAEAERAWTPGTAAGRLGRIARLSMLDLCGAPLDTLDAGTGFQVELEVESLDAEASFHVAVAVDGQDGRCVFAAATHWDGVAPLTGAQRHLVRLRVPAFPVASGGFSVSGFLFDDKGLHAYDQVVAANVMQIAGARWTPSLLRIDHEWDVPA